VPNLNPFSLGAFHTCSGEKSEFKKELTLTKKFVYGIWYTKITEIVRLSILKRPSQKSLPSFLFEREENLGGICGGRVYFFPLEKGRCEKIDLVLFPAIPAKAGIPCFHSLGN
jgi:hypothetical protein